MNITKLLNMTKSHILRVLLCSTLTALILMVVGIVNQFFLYIFISWRIEILQSNINASLPVEYMLVVMIWNYIIGVVVIGLLWKYIGMPKITFIGKAIKSFIDIYYVG